ncbi:hypothetical protein J9253_18525 [Thiothrix litoralis]|jgi:hypothetical protein|uniref:Uncharacterized protein n=1 Tax=Thiothrix litoralis TaxID=2891210 RepID=A0ABX7WQ12_9GAMM|nr:hypothetical protein [Thiothrix litoralis]QTR45956.1 hypothetical protein J9253_18525 [Thiothrix litoralis]
MTTAVFIKTPKGVEEVETKANGLAMIQRWVLISIDGKRTFADLKTLPRVNDLEGILTFLETGGYITPVSTPTSVGSDMAKQAPNTALSIFRPLPATVDPKTFGMAKHFMINTLNAFCGSYGATALVRSIDQCQTHEELRALFDRWHEDIANTRQGQKQGKDLQKKLLDVL